MDAEKPAWILAIALSVIALLLLPLPAWLLIDNYLDSGGVEFLPHEEALGSPRYNFFGRPVEVYPAGPGTDLCVMVEFLGLDDSDSTATLGILIDVTSAGAGYLTEKLEALKKHAPATGTLLIVSQAGLSNIALSFPVSALEMNAAEVTALTRADVSCTSSRSVRPSTLDRWAEVRFREGIFMLGTPRAFPDDWYELDDVVTVSVPRVPLSSSLVMTSRDEDYSLSASVYEAGRGPNAGPGALEFTIRRPWLFIAYTYIVAATPFFLLFAVFALKYLRKRILPEDEDKDPKGAMPKPFEVGFGVAATLVAILPLRSVLVPAALPSPTRLDIYFGTGAVFLVVASVLWVVATSPRSRPRGGESGADRTTASGQDG